MKAATVQLTNIARAGKLAVGRVRLMNIFDGAEAGAAKRLGFKDLIGNELARMAPKREGESCER